MTSWNGFRGRAKRLDDVDLPRIGATIGVGEDELHAFMDVEAAGAGFDGDGRPKMLFEPHVFYRNLAGDRRAEAVRQGLATKRWGTSPYPKDSYPRLEAAMAIDETAALKSASWGLTQILGENFSAVGYASVQDMVRAFMADEETHLAAMVQFLIANHIDDDLRDHRWNVVARVYNGPGYARHGYDTRMAKAFRKWARIRDTPYAAPAGRSALHPWRTVLRGVFQTVFVPPTKHKKNKETTMKGWRTLAINLAVAAFGVLEATDWTGLLGSHSAGWAVTGIGIANMVLRSITTTPVGRTG